MSSHENWESAETKSLKNSTDSDVDIESDDDDKPCAPLVPIVSEEEFLKMSDEERHSALVQYVRSPKDADALAAYYTLPEADRMFALRSTFIGLAVHIVRTSPSTPSADPKVVRICKHSHYNYWTGYTAVTSVTLENYTLRICDEWNVDEAELIYATAFVSIAFRKGSLGLCPHSMYDVVTAVLSYARKTANCAWDEHSFDNDIDSLASLTGYQSTQIMQLMFMLEKRLGMDRCVDGECMDRVRRAAAKHYVAVLERRLGYVQGPIGA